MAQLANADLLTRRDLWPWLVENFPWKIQIAHHWPFMGIDGGFLRVARTARFDQTDLANLNSECGPVTDRTSQPTDPEVVFGLANIITRYSVCFDDQDKFSNPNNLDRTEYVLAVQRLVYRYFRQLGLGATGSFNFPSLQDVVGTGQTIDMGGAALTFAALDQAYHLISENNGRPNAIMSNSRALRTYRNLFVATHGIEPPTVTETWTDPVKGRVSAPITCFNGTPWYINDLIDDQAGARGIVFFMVLGDDRGPGHFRGISGIVPRGRERNMFIKRQVDGVVGDIVVPSQQVLVPDVPTTITVNGATITPSLNAVTTNWVSWPCGMAMGAQGSLSILKGFGLVANLTTT